MVLVLVTVAVVALAVLLPAVLNPIAVPPPAPAPGANVQVDRYTSPPGWAGQFGDDPTTAIASNGTVAVGWEGLEETAPPSTPGGVPDFLSAIFVSLSTDGGQQFSPPRFVGAPGTVAAALPSLAFASNGTLFVAYANATNSDNQEIVVASASPGKNFSPWIVAVRGQDLGRPWLFTFSNGNLALAFEYNALVEWTLSRDGGRSFQTPTILLEGQLTGATQWSTDLVTLVGVSIGALTFTTVSIWSVTFNATGVGASHVGSAATFSMPYPFSADLPNIARPGPTVTAVGGTLYLVFAASNETELDLQTSTTNGSTWAGPWTFWSARNTTVETPAVEAAPDGRRMAVSWESTQGGYWEAYSALYDVRTGLLSPPSVVSTADGLPASVRNWHGTTMDLAITGSTQFVVVWGDGRGLTGTYGLTHIYSSVLTGQF